MRWTAELGRSAVPLWATLVAVALLAGCASDRDSSDTAEAPASSGAGSPAPTDAVPLPDGPLDPGRYEFVVSVDCEGVEDDPIACPAGAPAPPPIALEVTVPEGWAHMAGFPVITPTATGTEDAALVLGWTSNTVGVQTDPCLSTSHQLPDVAVGPGVDDFVDAVTAQEWYRGPAPVDTEVGGARGRYFTVRAPADLGRCHEWRPWDPGFFAQGPRNTWEVWVLDVDGHRVVVVTEYFPDTSSDTVAQLTRMVESISFRGV